MGAEIVHRYRQLHGVETSFMKLSHFSVPKFSLKLGVTFQDESTSQIFGLKSVPSTREICGNCKPIVELAAKLISVLFVYMLYLSTHTCSINLYCYESLDFFFSLFCCIKDDRDVEWTSTELQRWPGWELQKDGIETNSAIPDLETVHCVERTVWIRKVSLLRCFANQTLSKVAQNPAKMTVKSNSESLLAHSVVKNNFLLGCFL